MRVSEYKHFMQVFELGGNMVAPSLADNLMRLVAEGAGEGYDEADAELRSRAAASYLTLLSKPKLPDILLKVLRLSHSQHTCQCSIGTCKAYMRTARKSYKTFMMASVHPDVCVSRKSMTFSSFVFTPAVGIGHQRPSSARPSRADGKRSDSSPYR